MHKPKTTSQSDRLTAATTLYTTLARLGMRIVCAESCTGGLVTATITELPGSSTVLWGGIVAYSNECKTRLLDVPKDTITEFGAVSEETAKSMALGAIACSEADLAIAITGIAGPGGGSIDKPVGSVWFALLSKAGRSARELVVFPGDRAAIREAAAAHAMIFASKFVSGADIDKRITQVYSR